MTREPIPILQGTRDRIVDAAARVITEQGLSRATTKAVATSAGLSEAAIYLYFRSKRELLAAVVRERMQLPVFTAAVPADASTRPPRDVIVQIVETMIGQMRGMVPMLCAFLAHAETAELLLQGPQGARLGGIARVERHLKREQERGRIGRGLPASILARMLFDAAFHQAFLLHAFGGRGLPRGGRGFGAQIADAVITAAGAVTLLPDAGADEHAQSDTHARS